jgi:DNA polymerase I-like protein with 3'-5' exonuclease and polymerase domains/uracil-DNA glycosylase
MAETKTGGRSAPKKPQHIYADLDGNILGFARKWCEGADKRWLDLLTHTLGDYKIEDERKTCTYFDPNLPIGNALLKADERNPLCLQCTMNTMGCENPYMPPRGPEDPLITIVTEGVSSREDRAGELAVDGPANIVYELLQKAADQTGVDPDKDVRWLSTTRCAPRSGKQQNLATRGNWCRYFAVQDLMLHPPKLIMPVGSVALGLLSHKSNAQDWGGKLLTWRGWPDDWLTEPKFMLPRVDPLTGERSRVGHPIFGPQPPTTARLPMFPVQNPRIVLAMRNHDLTNRWKKHVIDGVMLAKQNIQALDYHRPWYRVSTDPKEIFDTLQELINCPGTVVAFDTETTGLKPWLGDRIVFMMFRWEDKQGNPRSIGFPWDYPESEIIEHLNDLWPQVLKAMKASVIAGHNLTFDMQFVAANGKLADREIEALVDAGKYDTWHMSYTHRQQRGSQGLEVLAYTHAPDLAGYEEDFVLLAELHKELLHPAGDKGGHYALCPKDKWDSHLIPYVMGDVEVTYAARDRLQEKLDSAHQYTDVPLAHPTDRGRFMKFSPPSRNWVYDNIISPSNIVLTKMMSRGMHVDQEKLAFFEAHYPSRITEARNGVMMMVPEIKQWADYKEQTTETEKDGTGGWVFDLEEKALLKEMLFHESCLGLDVQRLTKQGKKFFGDRPEDIQNMSLAERYEFAAVDKFTLNKLVADNQHLAPLLEYRKLFKLYTTYIKPLRNCYSDLVDKKRRDGHPHLCPDSRVHASFLLTGTRGGRLSCRDPNLQQLPLDADVKDMFTSRFGPRGCVYTGDLSQIELRLLAVACGDPSMMRAYFENLDLHTLTASRIFKLDYEMFSKDYMEKLQKEGQSKKAKELELKRKIGKTCNFLTGYGGGAFGLQTTLANSRIYMSIEECERILEQFFNSYPTLQKFLSAYKYFIQQNGVAVSITGRVRVFEEVFSEDSEAAAKALRAGCNHLIQATASDMMLICLRVIEAAMRDQGLESLLVSTVHDSLVIDAVREELPAVHEIVYEVLNNIPEVMELLFGPEYDSSWMLVPFGGDCEVGLNYGHVNKIPTKGAIDWSALLEDK